MDQYIGKMLDNRYEILERIGTGGMAIVYKAKCHRLNRLVAIKILKSDLAQNEEFRRRFNAESQAVAQLSHPNIVSVYDVSRGGDMEYIVMELIDGITLKQYMEKRGQLNWRESLHFITQIMRGLSHAHSRGIIHRDIKPQNIMVLRDGRFRHRLSGGFRPDPDTGSPWLRPLYFSGAGTGRPAGRPQRHLFLRRGAL